MPEAYIVDAVRTPVGRRGGGLSAVHPADLGAHEVSQFRGAEMIAEKWAISREDMELFAYESHQRAIRAIDEGRFDNEIVALAGVSVDEGPRRETSLEKMATLKPLVEGGRLT